MPSNLNKLSRQKWRNLGYRVDKTEHVQAFGGRVRYTDLWGFIDLMAVGPEGIVFLQVTGKGGLPARFKKLAEQSHGKGQWAAPMIEVAADLASIPGVRIVFEEWKKVVNKYVCREVEVDVELLLRVERGGDWWTKS